MAKTEAPYTSLISPIFVKLNKEIQLKAFRATTVVFVLS